MEYIDPLTGASPLRTMGGYMQLLPKGFVGQRYRSSASAVFAVIEGSASICIGDERWELAARDLFVVPGWLWHSFAATEQCVLFSFSDKPLQVHLDCWGEESAS